MKKRNARVVLVVLTLAALFAPTLVSAAAAASPGSTSTFMNMPVYQSFTGLTASTGYTLRLTTGGNVTCATFTSDSNGKASVTVTDFYDFGQNTYVLLLTGGADVLSFNINNQDIIPYFIPIIIIGILFTVMKQTGRI